MNEEKRFDFEQWIDKIRCIILEFKEMTKVQV